jgi:hypothetical protein
LIHGGKAALIAVKQRFSPGFIFLGFQLCYMILNIVSPGNDIFSRDQAILLVGQVEGNIFQRKEGAPNDQEGVETC